MKHGFVFVIVVAICACAVGQNGPNLILVNPGADAGQGAPTGYETVIVPGWTPVGSFTAVPWTIGGGFPIATNPGPPDRGANLFSGGATTAVSTGSQTISVAAYAALFDGGAAGYEVSGWFGGFSSQEDRASLTANFRSAAGALLGTAVIGNVTAPDRANATGLLYRFATGIVPVGTRSIEFILTMTRFAGSYNDGYADSVAFRLGSTAAVQVLGSGCGVASLPTLTATAPNLGLAFAIALNGAAANAPGQLLVSPPPASAVPIAAGCFAFLDLSAYVVLAPVATDASGSWNLGLTLPGDPGLANLQVVLQAYVAPGTGPFGLDITNGLLLTLGF